MIPLLEKLVRTKILVWIPTSYNSTSKLVVELYGLISLLISFIPMISNLLLPNILVTTFENLTNSCEIKTRMKLDVRLIVFHTSLFHVLSQGNFFSGEVLLYRHDSFISLARTKIISLKV